MASLFEQYENVVGGNLVDSGSNNNNLGNYRQQNPQFSGSNPNHQSSSSSNDGIINLRSNMDEPIFAKNKIDFSPPCSITHMVVSNNQLLMALENRTLLKIDLMNPRQPIEIDLSTMLNQAAASTNTDPAISNQRKPEISAIFIDPTGRHCLISTCLAKCSTQDEDIPLDNYYYCKKLYPLQKLKGSSIISAVGWNHSIQPPTSSQQSSSSSTFQLDSAAACTTGNILLGTRNGRLYETQLQSDSDRILSQSRELFMKQIGDFARGGETMLNYPNNQLDCDEMLSSNGPICAINCFRLFSGHSTFQNQHSSSHEYCVFVATKNFLFHFIGKVSPVDGSPYLYQIFSNPLTRLYKEMPGQLKFSQLDFFNGGSSNTSWGTPKSFGWLTKPGIFYGPLQSDLSSSNSNQIFDNANLILFNDCGANTTNNNNSNSSFESDPLSLILTRFHVLLLYPTVMKVICVVNKKVIMEDRFTGIYGPILGICKDPVRGTIWVYAQRAVYRYKINQEDRNIWEIFLEKGDFQSARMYAKDDLIKLDRTVCEEALYHFEHGDFKTSAHLFATTRSKSFEEIALKFIELRDKDQEALKEFLLCKLKLLSPVKERTQIIILLIWLFEIMLNQMAMLSNAIEDPAANTNDESRKEVLKLKVHYNRIEANFKEIISDPNYKACLKKNRKIIYNLILNHGNQSILVYFAEHIDDFDCLIEHHLQQGDYERTLSLLRKEECLTLYYRYSPMVVKEMPRELVNQLMPLAHHIDFAKLIPALVHFDHSNDQHQGNTVALKRDNQCKEILRFLEFCVFNLSTSNSVVHNYLIALYAQYQPDKLLTYLQLKGQDESLVPYDLRYAARICIQLGLSQATVHLLATMGAYEEAVEHALAGHDVDLAKQTAEKVQSTNQDLAKRLWLKIARYVIKNIYISGQQLDDSSDEQRSRNDSTTTSKLQSNQFTIKMATSILQECPLLKIEDILPYFPEFLTIDHFKDAICQSLEQYNRNIESLRDDMKVATDSAKEIREEIRKLRDRFTVVSAQDKCTLCGYYLMSKPFYSFHCGHLFHSDCLLDEIRPHLSVRDKKRLDELERALAKPPPTSGTTLVSPASFPSSSSMSALASSTFGHPQPSSTYHPDPTGSSVTFNKNSNSPQQISTLSSDFREQLSISEANRREDIYSKIDDIVAAECLLCGNYMISTIDKPFIDPEETYAMKGWD